nr:PAS domain S-box protein [Roseococcus sp. MDT2-1-1]
MAGPAALFAASPAPMLLLAPDAPRFTITDVNDAYLAAVMRAREDLTGRGVFEAMPDNPDDPGAAGAANLRASIERAITGKQPDRMPLQKYDIPRPDGGFEERWWNPVNAPVLDADGEVVAVIHHVVDATERVRAEAVMRESEARYRALFETIESGFCIVEVDLDAPGGRIDYRVVEANPAFYRQAGFSEAVLGQWLREVAPGLEEQWYEVYGRVALTGRPERFEQHSDMLGRSFEVYAFRVGEPEARLVAILFNDISARRIAEGRLRELNETLEQRVAVRTAERDHLWSLSQDMLARADYSGMMSAVSPAWTQVLGWSEAELLSRGYATFMHPDDMPPTLEAIARMAETRQPTRFENRIATRDGGFKPIEWTVAPEPDGVNFIAVGRDLSLAKAREAELLAAQDALRQSQKMEAMGQLTGGVAHDFNNLLTPIVGGLDMLQRQGLGGERERRLINGAMQSAERAKMLVQRLLAFARRQPLQATAIDVAKLMEGMADLLASTTGPQVRVSVDIASGLPPAHADPNQLEMALLNLGVNARDAMPDGGTLRLTAFLEEVRDTHRAGLRPGTYVCLSVSDTGVGMDEATAKRAIEPFFSTKGIGKGTGLGLSMVHGLTSQLGGGLSVASRLGVGTNVQLWLPASGATPEAEQPQQSQVVGQGVGTTLLVDDEEIVRASTADMLADLGYEVVEASSAEEALRLVGGGLRPDLVVTDHLMPGLSGTDLARRLNELRPGLPVVIVSGYAEVDGLAPDLPRLAKPFRRADLAASLAAVVRHR